MEPNSNKLVMINEFKKNFDKIYNDFFLNNDNFESFINKKNYYVDAWNYCRIDIKNVGNENNTLKIITNDDLKINYPNWFKNNEGEGCIVKTQEKNIKFTIKPVNSGKLNITLRAVYLKGENNTRIPIYINYKKLKINNEIIFSDEHLVSHDKPFKYNITSDNDQIFDVELRFETIFDYSPNLKTFLNNLELNEEDNFLNYALLNNYLSNQIQLFQQNEQDNYKNLILYNQLNKKLSAVLLENKKLNEEFSKITTEYKKIIDSYNKQFEILFLDYELTPRGILKDTHTLCVELLNFITNICNKHNINYWLDYGTLLGAVRHNGFIPWDDDVDIGMTRKDFNKFLEIIEEELILNNLQHLIKIKLDTTYKGNLISFLQIKYTSKTKYLFAGLDIFPYDFLKDEIDEEIFFKEQTQFKRKIVEGVKREIAMKNTYDNLNLTLSKEIFIIPGVDNVRGKNQKYKFKILNTETIFPLKSTHFCGNNYTSPNNTDLYLKKIYGKYNEMPKIIQKHKRISDLKKNPTNKKIYENEIQRMKKINAKF